MNSFFRRLCHSPIPRIATVMLVTLVFTSLAFKVPAQAVQDYSNTTVKNATGHPITLINITEKDGTTQASLFIVGEQMTFGNNQTPVKGSGYIVAKEGKKYRVLPLARSSGQDASGTSRFDQLSLRLGKIEWNDDGRTTQVRDLDPTIEHSFGRVFKITSDVANPTVKDGLLIVDTEKGRLSFDIRFGSTATVVGNVDSLFIEPNLDKGAAAVLDAAEKGDLEMVKSLLKNNPQLVSSEDKYGQTPLHLAAWNGNKDVAEFLLANKADVKVKDDSGMTPLHDAAATGHKDVTELLLANGAEVNSKTKIGWTPFDFTASNGHKDVAELLLANNADVNGKDDWGDTPLHLAAKFGNKDVTEFLLANKAEINAKDYDGKTPLGLAVSKDHEDVAELLRQHGGHE